ncbi:MAG: HAD-IC family P-type ATPase [Chloroflexota bacterium]
MSSQGTGIRYTGLTSAEVAERVARGESNNYRVRVDRTYWQIARDNIFNLFNIVLTILLVIIFLFHERTSVIFASFSVIANTVIGMWQEVNAKRTLDRLAAQNVQSVKVWRDGKITSIAATQVVMDDVLPIEPGDKLVVDGRVLHADSLEIDESLLTGESDAILKEAEAEVFSGSFCIAGAGVIVATQVGENSMINKLSRTAKAYRNIKTPAQRKVSVFVEIAVAGMLIFGPMLLVAGFVTRISLLETLKNTLVLVTSFVPQGLVLATTLSLTLGAIQISRRHTLVQRINAVESLANVNVLCFDKTGTLTRNELAVVEVLPLGSQSIEQIRELLTIYTANLAYQNKTAAAIAHYIGQNTAPHTNGHSPTAAVNVVKQQEIPFNSARKWGAIVLPDYSLILGAPERVLSPKVTGEAINQATQFATQGQRVLALARSNVAPTGENGLSEQREALALIVMSDQVRPDIKATLNAFYDLKIDCKVISGDNIETVRAIASAAGMHLHEGYTGEQLEAMSPNEFAHAAREANLFARIEPDTKRKIIAALKQQGGYVAMVGDGVNDVPALKEAQLAIVMNDGTQISKDVADIVLLDNAMSTLPLAFHEGQLITQKIYGTAKMFLTKNIYHVLTFILVGFMALPFPLTPVQISWAVFTTVNIPALLLSFGLLRPTLMRSFAKDVLAYVVASGVIGACGMALMYTLVYIITRRNTAVARSALVIFLGLYGTLVFWNTHGLDIFVPSSFLKAPRLTQIGVALILLTVVPMFILPRPFQFVSPPLIGWVLIATTFALTVTAQYYAMRGTRVLHDLNELLAP